jgi:regulator of protease activity HflC (stomatin/prohibitin superfamily)
MDDTTISLGAFIWEIVTWLLLGGFGIYLLSCIKILREYEKAVVFRLGRVQPVRGPGFVLIMPFIESAERVDMRVTTIDLEPQDIITKDNVSVSIKAVLYYQVVDAVKSEIAIDGYEEAAAKLATTALRYISGGRDLDDLLTGSDRLSKEVRLTVDQETEAWGIKIALVEICKIDLPEDMKRVIAAQAEAERQRRAKVIAADGEFQASQKLAEAAKIMSEYPASIQLRYMQTLAELGADNNTIIAFPLPMELFGLAVK